MIKLRIKEICKEKGITLNEVSERVGVSRVSMSGISAGRQKPSFDTIEAIATALDVNPSELFAAPGAAKVVCPYCGKQITIKAE